MIKKTLPFVVCILLYSITSFSATFSPNATYSVCFTPGEDCTAQIVSAVSKAQKSIQVQAHSFTSAPIEQSLVNAKNRGVDVQVILDKSQVRTNGYSSSQFLDHHQIPVWIDAYPAIAHNKVMIIDNQTVITGSFNFTRAAQFKNAENVIIINDPTLATKYAYNWQKRKEVSVPLTEYKRANG